MLQDLPGLWTANPDDRRKLPDIQTGGMIQRKNDRSHDVFDAMRKSRINWRDALVTAYGVHTYETYLWKHDRPAWAKVFGSLPSDQRLWGEGTWNTDEI